ncbi:MAG: hypothetical protein H0X40_03010 [Chthoniobacterales bacterium]|nr:hypothetical protein [Chthoniobacterales bacterium]
MKKLSPTARLLPDLAVEIEEKESRKKVRVSMPLALADAIDAKAKEMGIDPDEWCELAVRTYFRDRSPNDKGHRRSKPPVPFSFVAPGLLSSLAFDSSRLLAFLAKEIHESDRRIEQAMMRETAKKTEDEKLFSFIVWREVALLAHEFHTQNPEFRVGVGGMFNSPFGGITAEHLFCEEDLLDLFCEFLFENRDALATMIREENAAGRYSLGLAEALVIAEEVMRRDGYAPGSDSVAGSPAKLVRLMWATRIASIEERYMPKAVTGGAK